MKKYTLEEIKAMLSKNNFFTYTYETPIGKYAYKHAYDYDQDSDTLNCKEAIRDTIIYGARWVIDHLK